MEKNKKRWKIILLAILFIVLMVIFSILQYFNLLPEKSYTAEDFGIKTIESTIDYNGNGIDDYGDILLGARIDAVNKPKYKSMYYDGGYPPDNEGVCTDVIWRALKNAGYSLKDMVDKDIASNIEIYPRVEGNPDPNIDFRRVPNLMVYFDRHATSLTLDTNEIEEWQPGDIVVFGEVHIAIISDKRNKDGVPYIIHNGSQPNREEDFLVKYTKWQPITRHYRING